MSQAACLWCVLRDATHIGARSSVDADNKLETNCAVENEHRLLSRVASKTEDVREILKPQKASGIIYSTAKSYMGLICLLPRFCSMSCRQFGGS